MKDYKNKKISNLVRGKTTDGKFVLSGQVIFRLVDSLGFPLDLVQEELKKENYIFDLFEFCFYAKNSKNFSQKKLLDTLSVLSYYDELKFTRLIEFIYEGKNE